MKIFTQKFMKLRLLSILIVTLLAACTSPELIKAKKESPLSQDAVDVTAAIGIISDTQIHESRGTASRYASKAGDEFVEVTIRSGQQVVGSTDMMAQAIQRLSGMPMILHVGDAIDVSCKTEWDAFLRTINFVSRGAPWFLAEGNHDGYYVGNISPTDETRYNVGYWDEVCNQGRYYDNVSMEQRHFDKASVIKANLEHLTIQSGKSASLPLNQLNGTCAFGVGPLACASWHIDVNHPWTSYLTQLVRLPRAQADATEIYALILDSSTYIDQPNIHIFTATHLTGVEAGFTARQLKDAVDMAAQIPTGSRFFIVTHHHVAEWHPDNLQKDEQQQLTALLRSPKFLHFVLSAHTHEGGWYDQNVLGNALLELNTGSIADPPIYFRDLKFLQGSNGAWRVKSNYMRMTLDSIPDCASYKAPKKGSGYSVDEQRSENDRLKNYPVFLRVTGQWTSAALHFLAFWRSKHDELSAHLLTYRDVVHASLPAEATFSYFPAGTGKPHPFKNRSELEEWLGYLATCHDGERCSIQEKGNLLMKLEIDLALNSTAYSKDVIDKAHIARLCAAVSAVDEIGKDDDAVSTINANASQYEFELPPGS